MWNSKHLSAAIDQLRADAVPVKDENAARLSRSATPISTSWAATPSPPPLRPRDCGSSARSPTSPTVAA
ncbi:hypothetical protein [Nonomuraea salmonea]|uniref:Uncharacterized protein n=1 Tax=Nonomuraea salmonea TaxID=46181 RepID=A0ABV5NGL5_9ACTN